MRKRRTFTRQPHRIDGIYLMDPETGYEAFVTFDDLHQACDEIMKLPEDLAQTELGKPNFKYDETYNLRRKK